MILLFRRVPFDHHPQTPTRIPLATRKPNRIRTRSGLSLMVPHSSQCPGQATSRRHTNLQWLAMTMIRRLFTLLRALATLVDAIISPKRIRPNRTIEIHSLPVSEGPLGSRRGLNRDLRKGAVILVGHCRVPQVRERISLMEWQTRMNQLVRLFDDGIWVAAVCMGF